MQAQAAVLWEPGPWSVEEVEVRAPVGREVLIRTAASGLCYSDLAATEGRSRTTMPIIGGHEGAGVVDAVGPDVFGLQPGDHVVTSAIPNCGMCRFCTRGQPNLCDALASFASGHWPGQPHQAQVRGQGVGAFCLVGTFSELMLAHEASVIKIDPDIPLKQAALVGCGVLTGWCSSVRAAAIEIGGSTAIVGVGGVGMSAVQGAVHARADIIIAVEPVEAKREQALRFGATHVAADMAEAHDLAIQLTGGRGVDSVNLTLGSIAPEMVGQALDMTIKGGVVVLTGGALPGNVDVNLNLAALHALQKQVTGTMLGHAQPRIDIPRLLRLYQRGELKLDEMVSRTYRLDEINTGYDDLRAGRNLRGLISFD
jgi:NDMA-dependent alcohol dehydrogenase